MLVLTTFLRDHSEMSDPLSEILNLVEARTFVSGRLRAGGDWAVRFPPPDKVKFTAILTGDCWLEMDHLTAPARLGPGDVIAVNGRLPFVLTSRPGRPAVEASDLFRADGMAQAGEGDEVTLIGGHVAVEARRGEALMDVLPPLIHVRGNRREAAHLRWLLDRLAEESGGSRTGAEMAASHLAQLMFLEMLRAHLDQADGDGAHGWLAALADPRLAPALRLIHGDPTRALNLDELARACALSRTSFAVRFKATTGTAPLAYLAQWRIRLAERDLRDGREPVGTVARSVGYTSESAFTHAFKRVTGQSPRDYRRSAEAPMADQALTSPSA